VVAGEVVELLSRPFGEKYMPTTLPTANEFKDIILNEPLERVVEEFIFKGEPYVFRRWPQGFEVLRSHLCSQLSILTSNVIVIGSAKIGFSLNPDSFGRQFSEKSDIDVLVVSDTVFDSMWQTLLKWNYPRRYRLDGFEQEWAISRMDDVYWGWLRPDRIRFEGLSFPDALKPLRDLSTKWFNAFRSLSLFPNFENRDVSGRLYRSWDHAFLYHMDGLRKIKEYFQPR
jgi:hypothetical protein